MVGNVSLASTALRVHIVHFSVILVHTVKLLALLYPLLTAQLVNITHSKIQT